MKQCVSSGFVLWIGGVVNIIDIANIVVVVCMTPVIGALVVIVFTLPLLAIGASIIVFRRRRRRRRQR